MALAEILATAEEGADLLGALFDLGDVAKSADSDGGGKDPHRQLVEVCGDIAQRYDSLGHSLLADGEIDWAAASYVRFLAQVVETTSKKAAASPPATGLPGSLNDTLESIARDLTGPIEGLGDATPAGPLDPQDRRTRGIKALELSGQFAALADLLKVYPTVQSMLTRA